MHVVVYVRVIVVFIFFFWGGGGEVEERGNCTNIKCLTTNTYHLTKSIILQFVSKLSHIHLISVLFSLSRSLLFTLFIFVAFVYQSIL